MRTVYLDYAAATPVDLRVFRAMRPYFGEKFGNPGSLHRRGVEALAALDRARETLAAATGVPFRGVVFTASATEANNLALRGVIRASKLGAKNYQQKPRVVISAVEHDSVLETARDMERAGEIELAVIPVDRECLVNLGALEAALDRRTMLVSVMYVNNEVGTIQPIAKVADLIRRVRSSVGGYPLFHTDAAQAFLYYRCGVEELGVDLMTLSSQKIHGPKGAGALVVREGALEPEVTGGGQEFGLRAGTENVPAIIGFAAAVSITERERARNIVRVAKLRDTFERELLRRVPGTVRNGPRRALLRAPHITNIAFSNVSSEDLLVRFDRVGVAASPGAACSSRALARRSHVLRAMGIPDRRIERSIRFSMGKDLARLDVVRAAERVARAALLFPETPVILRKSRKKRRNIT